MAVKHENAHTDEEISLKIIRTKSMRDRVGGNATGKTNNIRDNGLEDPISIGQAFNLFDDINTITFKWIIMRKDLGDDIVYRKVSLTTRILT